MLTYADDGALSFNKRNIVENVRSVICDIMVRWGLTVHMHDMMEKVRKPKLRFLCTQKLKNRGKNLD